MTKCPRYGGHRFEVFQPTDQFDQFKSSQLTDGGRRQRQEFRLHARGTHGTLGIAFGNRNCSDVGLPVGFAGFTADAWFGLVAPSRTPEPIGEKLQQVVANLLTQPNLHKTLTELGMMPVGNSATDFARALDRESTYWAVMIKRMGLMITP